MKQITSRNYFPKLYSIIHSFKKNARDFWLLGVLMFFAVSILSAQNVGKISGMVTDLKTEEPIISANVYFVGTALGNSTDREGKYRITQITPDVYTLRITCLGYKAKEIEVNISAGENTVNVQLIQQMIEGAEILVTGQVRGQVAAINQQLASNTIVNVVSEEKIQELPDANAAEAIGRLPGVSVVRSGGEANRVTLRGLSDKFGDVTVDGIRMASTDPNARGVDLSAISQGSLAGIELYKALTPDKDADAIAGSINLVTKKAPSERLIRADLKGAYNKLNNTFKQYDFSLRYGERFFNDVLGLQLTGNIERRDRSSERITLDYNQLRKDGTDYDITNFYLEHTNEIRNRGGISLLSDINTPDGGWIKVNNIYNSTKRDYVIFKRNYPTLGREVLYGAQNIERNVNTFNSSITGMNYLWDFTADWGLSFAQSKSEDPFNFEMSFLEPSSPTSGMRGLPDSILKGPPELFIPYAYNNFQIAFSNIAFYRFKTNLDKEKTAFLNLSRKYVLDNSLSGELKLGGKYRYKNRFKNVTEMVSPYYLEPFRLYTKLPNGTIVRKNLTGTRFEGLLGPDPKVLVQYFLDSNPKRRDIFNKYNLYPMLNRDALRLWYELNKDGVRDTLGNGPEFRANDEVKGDYYDIVERVSAGYMMNTFNLGQAITLITGMRVEKEDNDYISKYSPYDLSGFPVPSGLIQDTTVSFSETVWLPNFHLSVRPYDFLHIRLAAYKALARPDFNYRLEKFVAKKAGTFFPNNNLTVGNPRLTAAKAWNFEVNASLFSSTMGLVSLSAFYKDIKHMYHFLNGALIEGTTAECKQILDSLGIFWRVPTYGAPSPSFNLTYPYNSKKPTRVWGFEGELQANMTFLPGLLKNLILSGNLSIIRSETYFYVTKTVVDTIWIPGFPFPMLRGRSQLTEMKNKLEGQPEIFGNMAVGYDIYGFSARISYFYQGEFDHIISPTRREDEAVKSFSRWDLALKQKINKYITFTLNINNFTNVREDKSYKNRLTNWDLLDESELYGMSLDFGTRITF